MDLLGRSFEQERQIGRGITFSPSWTSGAPAAQPVASRIDCEVVPPPFEDDESGACSRPGDRGKPPDQRVRRQIADPGDRSGSRRRLSRMRLRGVSGRWTAEQPTWRRKQPGGEVEPAGAPEQSVRGRLEAVRQRRLPGSVRPHDGDEQPGGATEPACDPGRLEPGSQRESSRCSTASLDQAADALQCRERGDRSPRALRQRRSPLIECCAQQRRRTNGSASNSCWS